MLASKETILFDKKSTFNSWPVKETLDKANLWQSRTGYAMTNADRVLFATDADREEWGHYDKGSFALFRPFVRNVMGSFGFDFWKVLGMGGTTRGGCCIVASTCNFSCPAYKPCQVILTSFLQKTLALGEYPTESGANEGCSGCKARRFCAHSGGGTLSVDETTSKCFCNYQI